MAQMALAVTESADAGAYHYFSAHACVFADGSRRSVFIGGTLVSTYDVADKGTRNAILVGCGPRSDHAASTAAAT